MSTPPRHRLGTVARDGTMAILVGTVVASVGAYGFQVVGGRVLGAAAFAPVTALLTVHFLVFTVLLMPVEQHVIRRITLDEGSFAGARGVEIYVVAAAATGAAAVFTATTVERFFGGEPIYVAIIAAAVLTNFILAVGRGHLAGVRRFRSYGQVSGAVAMLRIGLVAAVLPLAASGPTFGWALAAAPLTVLAWRPLAVPARLKETAAAPPGNGTESAGRFLGGFILANAASQVLLLSAPLVVGALEDSPVMVSVVFVTFQLFRAPIVMAQNLIARILPPFTTLAAGGFHRELRQWALRIAGSGLGLGVLAAAAGGLLGPAVVSFLFGGEFRPTAEVAALGAAGMVLAAAALFASQILVARGQTPLLAAAWAAGFALAAVAIGAVSAGADTRVSIGFVAGEAGALGAIVAAVVGYRQVGTAGGIVTV